MQRQSAPQSGLPVSVWVALAAIVVVGVILYFVYDRSMISVLTSVPHPAGSP